MSAKVRWALTAVFLGTNAICFAVGWNAGAAWALGRHCM